MGDIQHLSGANFISMVAIGIMMNLLFLFGVVLVIMMTTSTSTVILLASAGSIKQEGNAMADIARAIPGLTTLSGMDRWILFAYCMHDLQFFIPFL